MTFRYACMDCGARADDNARCPACGQGPMLDLADREVRQGLVEDDERRRAARDRRMVAVSVGLVVPLGLVLAFVPGFWDAMRLVGINPVFTFVLTLSAAAFGLSRLLLRVFPSPTRFPYATDR